MTLSRIVEIGEVGFPVQAPYHGFIIRGESYNTGIPYLEDTKYSCSKEPLKTYVKGIARFGVGENALYCDYNLNTSAERPQP